MKNLPIKTKLFVATLATILLLTFTMTWRSYSGISELSEELSALTQKNLKEEVVARLQTEASAYGEQVGNYINSAFRIPLTFKNVLEQSIQSENRLSRDQVNDMFQQLLIANKDISSAYVQFEANAYDGQDEEFTDGQALHSVADYGSFELYWYRNKEGKVTQESVEDIEEKHLADKNEFGVRKAEWYLCPMDTKLACLVEPYIEEIEDGYSELMSTLSAPVIVDREFKGTIGVDINLPLFQKLTEKLSKSLYNGEARVTLVSQLGLIVASSHYQ
ncbi:MAG: cache domain-containing protein, partial [Venatoribacter sp.]